MKGSEARFTEFMDGVSKRFIIPVYQRHYDWKLDNCRQLYNDLKKTVQENRDSHFFGSIVASVVGNGATTEYHIIDGQQRLTTVTLLFLAMRNLIEEGKILPKEGSLAEQIDHRFLIYPWSDTDERIKLRPVKSDKEALKKLFDNNGDFDMSSNLTLNYQYFYDTLLREEVPIDDLYSAVGRLEIISITLDHGDNAQLIFESLNSTGLALAEGDKIRNYILMGLEPNEQNKLYDRYWVNIEKKTEGDVSSFVRDFLSIKRQITPTVDNIYRDFKTYAEDTGESAEELLKDLCQYAGYYEKLLTGNSGLKNQELDDCLYRLNRLEITVTRPFFMEVLRLNDKEGLPTKDVLDVFLITENYLFRRNICDVPTNALNKIFLTLNKDILRYDGTINNYVGKFIYTLLSKKESGRFPNDDEFTAALAIKQVYQMRGRYKAYLFERFENFGTVETKDVYTHLDNRVYTIEHIMPQHLSPAWVESLGENYEEIHATWLHRLANLTLTGYNPDLSNHSFADKRDDPHYGYRVSGLRMNQKIAEKNSWGEHELEERSTAMVEQAKKIWKFPETNFKPAVKEFDSCTLDDEDIDLTGRNIVRFKYLNVEQPITSWVDMFEKVIKYLHQKDKSVLTALAYGLNPDEELSKYVSNQPENLRSAIKIDENIYFEKNTSTTMKLNILLKLFPLYGAEPSDLVFYLKDAESGKMAEEDRHELRRRYWEYALPIIQKQNVGRGIFSKVHPGTSNVIYGSFGISGFNIQCIANYDFSRVCFYMCKGDAALNKEAFDVLYSHKQEIEEQVGHELLWSRSDETTGSWIDIYLFDVSITNEEDWPRMAQFHAEWSNKLCDAFLPYLQDISEDTKRLEDIASILREWAINKEGVNINLDKCGRTYTRFTTPGMSEILPDIENAPSGWNTNNHYFYEITNYNGKSVHINLELNSTNATDEFMATCERINDIIPAVFNKKQWIWRNAFRTSNIDIGEDIDKDALFSELDKCYDEIMAYESELKQKLSE